MMTVFKNVLVPYSQNVYDSPAWPFWDVKL